MNIQPKILIVDDTAKNIQMVAGILSERNYDLSFATSGTAALALLSSDSFDLVLLDIMMPEMDGYEVCQKLKGMNGYKGVPVIFLTAKNDEDSIVTGFDCGGHDYITKPFRAAELLARVNTHLKLKAFEDSLQVKINQAVKELKLLNDEIIATQKEVIFTMGSIGEYRSKETGMHVKRVAEYSKQLALLSGLDEEESDMIRMASPMHDIGKVGINDSILHKPGKLTVEEFEIMKTHVDIGYDMLKHSSRPLMKAASIIAHEHHERWDGEGYPRKLKGDEIHLYGRITALADVFDALGSERCYKKAWDDEKLFTYIKDQKGQQFDPQLVDGFFSHMDVFLEIRNTYKD